MTISAEKIAELEAELLTTDAEVQLGNWRLKSLSVEDRLALLAEADRRSQTATAKHPALANFDF